METPLLYRQLQTQLRQWVTPKDQRHLQGVAESVAAILQSQSASMGRWIPYLGHRPCQARGHLERLSYLVHNPHISAERFYAPLIREVLKVFEGSALTLVLDTSMVWDNRCLIAVCLAWGGRSLTLAQVVLEHGSATVGFEDYQPVLEQANAVLPSRCRVTLLADRGFQHGALLRWLHHHDWNWAIRVKSDLSVTLATGLSVSVEHLLPTAQQAYLFHDVTVLGDIQGHLATAHLPLAGEPWAVFSNQSPSLQTFVTYGQRFGGIEPHFKDYKSAVFDVTRSGLRNPAALTCLFMLLDCASLLAVILGMMVVQAGQRGRLDWHGQRGLSFLQLGLRELARLSCLRLPIPMLTTLPKCNPPPACASQRKRERLDRRLLFSNVFQFST